MNVLFLTLLSFDSLQERNIYTDLLRELVKNGHRVYTISPTEKRQNQETHIIKEENVTILRLQIGNTQKTNIIEKGISTMMVEPTFKKAIRKYFSNVKFDLVLYSTPPITFAKVIDYVKRRDNAKSYLLLKDIFPQNAVDLGMFSKNSIFYKYFRYKEKQLYKQSDYIGCMSQANVDYIIKHNPEINPEIVHVSPNSVEPARVSKTPEEKVAVRQKFNIPQDSTVFIYGGNLGKPQDIPFVVECLKANADKEDRYFVISGTGTEYPKLKAYVDCHSPSNVLLINGLPKTEYDELVSACDVGLIFLDHRFTIPNFPSRLLAYMQSGMPVIACTDVNTDIGDVVEKGGFGWKCISDNVENFTYAIDKACMEDLSQMGDKAKVYLTENYTTGHSYKIIMERVK